MTATFIHQGDAIDHLPATDLDAGAVVVLTDLVGITTRSIPAGHLGALQLRGVFDLPKATGGGKAIAAGKKVYWHPTNEVATTAANGAVFLGNCVRDAGDNDATVRVRLAVGA
jgi:predicted RecA/RadA family phage recombinase